MTKPERLLLFTLGGLYAVGILLALLTTGKVVTYLPHAAVFLFCALALRHMLHGRLHP